MNKAEVYIAKLRGLMNRFIELGKEYKGKPDSKKRQATIKQVKSQINDYREKLEGLGMGTITKTLFQVTYYEPPKEDGSKVVKEEKVFHSLHVNTSNEEIKVLLDYTFKREDSDILIINHEVAKTGYYEEKQKTEAPITGESGTGRKGRKSKKEA